MGLLVGSGCKRRFIILCVFIIKCLLAPSPIARVLRPPSFPLPLRRSGAPAPALPPPNRRRLIYVAIIRIRSHMNFIAYSHRVNSSMRLQMTAQDPLRTRRHTANQAKDRKPTALRQGGLNHRFIAAHPFPPFPQGSSLSLKFCQLAITALRWQLSVVAHRWDAIMRRVCLLGRRVRLRCPVGWCLMLEPEPVASIAILLPGLQGTCRRTADR